MKVAVRKCERIFEIYTSEFCEQHLKFFSSGQKAGEEKQTNKQTKKQAALTPFYLSEYNESTECLLLCNYGDCSSDHDGDS